MNSKKKIALIIDTQGWAFHNIAKQIVKHLDNTYEIDIIPGDIFFFYMIKLFIYCQKYDLIHFFWRGYLSLIDNENMNDYLKSIGYSKKEFYDNYIVNKNITTTVCDHLYLNESECWRTNQIFKYVKNYITTSQKLFDIYSEIDTIKKPQQIIHDGVDLNLYAPNNLSRYDNLENITIGWVGNSKFVDSDNDSDLKGLRTIINPAIEELKNEGYDLDLKIADRNNGMIQQEDMPDYYNSIDLYVCASKTEGTPLPILEAMACGIPIISTDVGIVKECFGKEQSEFILNERSKEALKEKIKELYNNKSRLKELSNENLEQVKQFSWDKITIQYADFFESNL